MLKPAAPPDEAARLSAPRALDVLDTPAEERGVADHARAVRGSVAGVAQVEQRRPEAPSSRHFDHAVYRQRAAGLLEFVQRGQLQDTVDGGPVLVLRFGVGQAVGKVR